MAFTEKQKIMVYESAIALKQALIVDSDPLAKEFLAGKLGSILDAVINKKISLPISDIPHFELMTKDCLARSESEYFNFYSLARFGKPAFE
ncbi:MULTISPECIES: hypothetical protein [Vibrio]|nr:MULTISPECIES: hypothetical protein [Vibrio]ELV8644570.1 hypothetical protein [Vibrio vulnificus]MBJ6888846.1 hypothetical protein [Vibrio cholerae]MBJ6945475.1 hypothetical protein [Vibrio cholerae]PAR38449.1 hypothetical protein CGT98_14120 [Vibrio metoecus]